MATKKKVAVPVAPAPSPGWFSLVFTYVLAFLKSDFVKWILSAIALGGTAGYTVKGAISDVIPNIGMPKIPKLLPRPWKSADAIGQIRFGNSGCTATIIGPVHPTDSHVEILTAAHCVQVGSKGTMKLKDGRTLAVTCVSRAAGPDVAWLKATNPGGTVPYLLLADAPPPPGSKIWHQGYGIDNPGNKEEGSVAGISPNHLQMQYRLSVSPGDSGGGIVLTEADKVVSPVCCTTRLGGMGDVWGGTPAEAAKIRPSRTASTDEPEAVRPMLILPDESRNAPIDPLDE